MLGSVQHVHRGRGSSQVVIKQPGQRRPPLPLRVLVGGEVGGVGAQQVVHAVPTGTGGLHQVRPGQQIKQLLGLLHAGVDQGGGGVGVQVRAGVQPEQPKLEADRDHRTTVMKYRG